MQLVTSSVTQTTLRIIKYSKIELWWSVFFSILHLHLIKIKNNYNRFDMLIEIHNKSIKYGLKLE